MASLQEPPQERRHLSPRQLKVQRPALSAPRTFALRTCPAFSAPGSLHPDLHAPHLPCFLRTRISPSPSSRPALAQLSPHPELSIPSSPHPDLHPAPPTSALAPRQPRARPHLRLVSPQPQPARSSVGLWEAESFRGQAAKVRKVEGTDGLREGLRARPLPPYLFRAVGSMLNCKPLHTCQ